MNLPKSLKIGGRNFTIRYPYVFDSDNLTGQYCPEIDEIRIKQVTKAGEVQSEPNQGVCLIHEVLHAINDIYCMHQIGKECDPEVLLDALAEGVYQILADNYFEDI